MNYLPNGTPLPAPGPEDEPFWAYCGHRELRIQQCAECGEMRFPPKPRCPRCLAESADWVLLPGTGALFTYTVVHHIVEAALVGMGSYNIAVIELDGTSGIRMLSNVVDARSESELKIGMPVEITWDDYDGTVIPRFRRSERSRA